MPTKETMTYFTSFFVLILSLFVGNAHAEVAPAPELAVKAYLLKDFNSNRVLAEQQSQSRVEPAMALLHCPEQPDESSVY